MNYSKDGNTTVADILSNYENYLKTNKPSKSNSFLNLKKQNIESAQAEAVVFSILKQFDLDPEPLEENNQKRMDFLCNKNGNMFYIEVTNISCEKMTEYTGWRCDKTRLTTAFRLCTKELQQHVINKTSQMSSGGNLPRVLALTTHHPYPLDAGQAKELMTDTFIYQQVTPKGKDAEIGTSLYRSVFFRFNHDRSYINPCRKSISAIILINIQADRSKMMGLLHPEPSFPFPVHLMEDVPFLRIKNWPLEKKDEISAEFISPKDRPFAVLHGRRRSVRSG